MTGSTLFINSVFLQVWAERVDVQALRPCNANTLQIIDDAPHWELVDERQLTNTMASSAKLPYAPTLFFRDPIRLPLDVVALGVKIAHFFVSWVSVYHLHVSVNLGS